MDGLTTAQVRNARADREVRKALVARNLARLLDRHGVTRADVAAVVGVSHQHVQQWADPEGAKHLSVADSMALPPALRAEIAELVAGPEHVVALLPTVDPQHAPADLHAAATLSRTGAATLNDLLTGLSDGILDPVELRALDQSIDDQLRELVSLRAAVKARLASFVPRPLKAVR